MTLQKIKLADDLEISRIINGLWQISEDFSPTNNEQITNSMLDYHNAGFSTWDLADSYGFAENYIGNLKKFCNENNLSSKSENIRCLFKIYSRSKFETSDELEKNIRQSLDRMHSNYLDLLQFHCWDYDKVDYLKIFEYFTMFQDMKIINHLGVTNFDTKHLELLKDNNFEIVSNQIQYSLIDSRPQSVMENFCKQNNVKIIAYGTLCGGFISENFLGKPEPSNNELSNPSLLKYKKFIDNWGGWNLFQNLLSTLYEISSTYGVSIANVATRYILDKPNVAGVILGTRFGINNHINENLSLENFNFTSDENKKIDEVLKNSNDLFSLIGDCGSEFR